MGENLGDLFLHGGWGMWPLLMFSVVSWAVLFERLYFFITVRPKMASLARAVLRTLSSSGDRQAAVQLCHAEKPLISEVFLLALDSKRSRPNVEKLMERARQRLTAQFKKHLWILGTVGSASPFVGLLGTVVGIVRAFHSMAEKGAGGFSVVAGGISEALVATAAGLIVAIISVLAYNTFVNLTNQTILQLRLTLEDLLDITHSNGIPGREETVSS